MNTIFEALPKKLNAKPPKGPLEKCRELQKTYTDALAKIPQYSRQAAHLQSAIEAEALQKALKRGEPFQARGFEAIAQEFELKINALKSIARTACIDAIKPSCELRTWMGDLIEQHLKETEQAEQSECRELGIAWEPSAKIKGLRQALDRARRMPTYESYAAPKDMSLINFE